MVTNRTAQSIPKGGKTCEQLCKFTPEHAVFREIRRSGPRFAVSRRNPQFHAERAVFRPHTQFGTKIAGSRETAKFCGCHPSYELTKNRTIIFCTRLNSLLECLKWLLPSVASWLATRPPPGVTGVAASLCGFLASD